MNDKPVILYIDQDGYSMEAFAKRLGEEGFEVIHVSEGNDAYRVVHEAVQGTGPKPDLILSATRIDHYDIGHFIPHVRNNLPGVPFIGESIIPQNVERFRELGADAALHWGDPDTNFAMAIRKQLVTAGLKNKLGRMIVDVEYVAGTKPNQGAFNIKVPAGYDPSLLESAGFGEGIQDYVKVTEAGAHAVWRVPEFTAYQAYKVPPVPRGREIQ